MRAILESRTLPQLKKMIRDTNITGYSKLKKSEIIDKMMKEDERFKQYVLKNHTTPKTPIKKTTTHKIPDGKIMSGTTHKKESKEVKKPEVKKEVKKPEVKPNVKYPNVVKYGHKLLEPKKEPKKLIPKFDFDSSKINIKEKTNKSNDKYYDIYYEYNNVYIEAAITHSKQFYLDTFEAQSDEDKPRAPKGMANYYLCELLKSLIKNTKLNLKTSSDFTLSAGNIVESGFNQEKLNKYYEGLGFKKDGPINKSKNQDYKQSISSFLKNCEKFEKK